MAEIHQPQPRAKSPETSKRLLASHHSIYEALQDRSSSAPPPSSGNTPALVNLEFSATSWQSITDSFLAPRPTSSVLSSSDTEEDEVTHGIAHQPPSSSGTYISPLRSNVVAAPAALCDSSNDTDKTIEINLNDATRTRHFFGIDADCSSFVMPEMMDSPNGSFNDISGTKILIIGNKKYSFYKQLDTCLRNKFTLNINDPHKIVIVIFDGLIKIGNILNFIKNHIEDLREKLFIPIFRNLNSKIVDKILNIYNVELLCPPVSLDNESQLQHLLDFLREDFLLQSTPALMDTPHKEASQIIPASANDLSPDDFQLIRLQNGSVHSSEDISEDETSSSLYHHPSSKSVVITHQIERVRHSKKLKRRKKLARYPKWALLGISLSIGIGIGVTVAYSLAYFKTHSRKNVIPVAKETSLWKNSARVVKSTVKKMMVNTDEFFSKNVSSAKHHVEQISRLVFQGTSAYLSSFKTVCNELFSKAEVVTSPQVQASFSPWWLMNVIN